MTDSKEPSSLAPEETPEGEEALGTAHENLEGWAPGLDTEDEIRAALEKAFDYRGDLLITLRDGGKIEGYVFDRKAAGPSLADCVARVMPKNSREKISIRYSDVAGLSFGRDTAAGKSFAAWVRKYNERKAAGEENIGIEPEPLD